MVPREGKRLARPAIGAGARPARGTASRFLAQLAAAPVRELAAAWASLPRPGAVIGRFEILRELGRGGFGVVYEARDQQLRRLVAFKALRPPPSARGQLEVAQREAEAAAQLNHPNIVALHDLGAGESGPYLIFELLRGETLADRLERGRLAPGEAARVALAVAGALEHAHGAGVIHRELKPSNVFLSSDGQVKVLDFGLASVLGGAPEVAGGTPGYMAPEQWRGEPVEARTDVFGAAAMLCETLTGRLPYPVRGDRSAVLEPGAEPDLAGVPAELAPLLRSAVSPDPSSRPADGKAWKEALQKAAGRMEARASRRRRSLLGVAGLATMLLGGALAVTVGRTPTTAGFTAGEPITIAIADVANETDDAELDGLSGLLVTSLEESRRLTVLTRARLGDLLKQLGHEPTVYIDEALGREAAARAGARALLVPSVRVPDGRYVVDVKVLDPAAHGYTFAVRDLAEAKAGIPELLDRIAERLRLYFQERPEEVRASRLRLTRAITAHLDAYRHCDLGRACEDRFGFMDCEAEFRAALRADPEFALAHYQLAYLAMLHGSAEAQRAALEAALRHVQQLPTKERLLIQAWDAMAHRRDEEALAMWQRMIREYPNEKQAFYLVGDHLFHRDELAQVLPFFERAVALDPSFGWALDHLVATLGILGRRTDLAARRRGWEQERPSVEVLHAISLASAWLGDEDHALDAARRAGEIGGRSERYWTAWLLLSLGRTAWVSPFGRFIRAMGARPDEPARGRHRDRNRRATQPDRASTFAARRCHPATSYALHMDLECRVRHLIACAGLSLRSNFGRPAA